MNTPTWTTVFGGICVGVALGHGSGVIIGMALERWNRSIEKAIEDMVQRREEEKESKLDERTDLVDRP
jgi:hypothetical protein